MGINAVNRNTGSQSINNTSNINYSLPPRLLLEGRDRLRLLSEKYYSDILPEHQVYLFNTDKLGFKAIGYEGDSFESFIEDSYAEIIDNALAAWDPHDISLQDYIDKLMQGARAAELTPLEEQGYLLLEKMLGGDRSKDIFFKNFIPYLSRGIGKAQHGGDLSILFLPSDISEEEVIQTMALVDNILEENPSKRLKALLQMVDEGDLGMLREEIKAVTIGSDTFLNQGEEIRLALDNAVRDILVAEGIKPEPVDYRKLREDKLLDELKNPNSQIRNALIDIYEAIAYLKSKDGYPLRDGYKEDSFTLLSSKELKALSPEELRKQLNGHTFRKAFSIAEKDPKLMSSTKVINDWVENLKTETAEARVKNFQMISPKKQQELLTLEMAITFTGIRDAKFVKGIIDKIKNNDKSWKDELYIASIQSYIDITRTGLDNQGSFIEYHQGFRGFLEELLGLRKPKNPHRLVMSKGRGGTVRYGVLNAQGEVVYLYGQANNTKVDANHLFGKLTYNHKPTKSLSEFFPTVRRYF